MKGHRIWPAWWALAVLACAEPGWADDALVQLLDCRTLIDSAARLACFDRESAKLQARKSAAPALAPLVPLPDPKKQFGLPEPSIKKQEVAAGTRAADAAKIEARVRQVSQSADGRAFMTLDNDQEWRQVSADVDLMLKSGDAVTISRAALGSFWLQTKLGRGTKVNRLH